MYVEEFSLVESGIVEYFNELVVPQDEPIKKTTIAI